MRILIVSHFFPPENSIASLRPYSWAKYWAGAGHEVTVLTTPKKELSASLNLDCSKFNVVEVRFRPFFYTVRDLYNKYFNKGGNTFLKPEEKKQDNNSQQYKISYFKKQIQNLNLFRLNRGIFNTARMPDLNDLWIKPASDWAIKQDKWDLVVSTHGPYACHMVAHNLKKEDTSIFWIADFRDLWTDNHIYKGVFPFTLVENSLEKKTINQANAITTVSKPLAATLGNKYGSEKVFVVENGFDSDDLSSLQEEPIFNDNKIRLVYTGTVYKGKQDPTPLFESILELARSGTHLNLLESLEVLFVGSTSYVVMEIAQNLQVTKWVKTASVLPRTDILRMQRDANALLFLEFDNGKTDGILTGKLFEYLYSGTEIWGIGVKETSAPGKIISESRSGINFGNNKTLIMTELIRLLTQPVKRTLYLNTDFIKLFERRHLAEVMLSIVK